MLIHHLLSSTAALRAGRGAIAMNHWSITMGTMLKQMWVALSAFFTMVEVMGHAGTKVAKSLDHLGGWCEETAGTFADQAREERKQAMAALTATTNRSLITNGLPATTNTTE